MTLSPVQNPDTHPAPGLAVGETVTLDIHDVAFGGDGVGRCHDFVVFVPFTLVGERVEAQITEVKKSYARARPVRVLTSSPHRVEPRCRHYCLCGGCQYQHAAYEEQVRMKHKQVADLFERIGGFDPKVVAAPVKCPQPYGYRNRIMIRSQWNKPEQRLNIGFVRWDCGLVEDVFRCEIAEEAINGQISHVHAHPPPKGGIKVVLRIPPENWEVPPDSFFQNNFFMLPGLVQTVRERLQESGSRFLVDVYCGVGFFGIELAGAVERFAGVEIDARAIVSARKNMESRGITNGRCVPGAAELLLPELLQEFPAGQTTVLLDPPRKGCAPSGLESLLAVRPAQVIYVSCHPATMARDLKRLCEGGVFELVKVVPVDMFPQTQHVECVADLRHRTHQD
jgi:tRNA/tmRNA/rRNA uracil-C5-methylase (TrmA/RlmC/RlmD family)